MAAAIEEAPVPPQVQAPEVYDFRGFTVAPRGYKMKNKRKMEDLEEQVIAISLCISACIVHTVQ